MKGTYTKSQIKRYQREFAIIERRVNIAFALLLIVTSICFLLALLEPIRTIAVLVFLIFLFSFGLFCLATYRCPACNRYLGKRFNLLSSHCPECEAPIRAPRTSRWDRRWRS